MSTGYSGTPLPRKLGVREGHRVAVLGDPGHVDRLLADLPAGAALERDPPAPREPLRGDGDAYDVVLAFARARTDLAGRFRHGARLISWQGGLWIAWPKKRSPLHVDLAEGDVRGFGLAEGLVDNKICAVDADWSGLRFVVRVADRPRGVAGRS